MTVGAHARPQLSLVSVKPGCCGWCRRQVLCESHRRSIRNCRCRSHRSLRSLRACVWLPSLGLSPGAARAVALQGTAASAPACDGCCGTKSPHALGSPCPTPGNHRQPRLGGHRAVGLGPPACPPRSQTVCDKDGTRDLPSMVPCASVSPRSQRRRDVPVPVRCPPSPQQAVIRARSGDYHVLLAR